MTATPTQTRQAPTGHVQIIVILVNKEDPAAHIDAIHAAARASVNAYAEGRPSGSTQEDSWTRWLAGPFTKSVRRADAKTFAKLQQEFDPAHAQVGKARALAFKPTPYEELPKALARLQVSGTVLPEKQTDAPGTRPVNFPAITLHHEPVLVVNDSLRLSTGKACAQGAHALMAFYLALGTENARNWHAEGLPSTVVLAEAALFEELAQVVPEHWRIKDNGLTEVTPGTMTAFVVA